MPHPDGLPDLFIDRSLGRLVVPRLLRAEGLRLTTLAERYGIPADESISDVTWLADIGARQEVAFMKDDRIRYRTAEKAEVIETRVRAFCLARRDLDGAGMAHLFLRNMPAITAACQAHPIGIWVVTKAGLRHTNIA